MSGLVFHLWSLFTERVNHIDLLHNVWNLTPCALSFLFSFTNNGFPTLHSGYVRLGGYSGGQTGFDVTCRHRPGNRQAADCRAQGTCFQECIPTCLKYDDPLFYPLTSWTWLWYLLLKKLCQEPAVFVLSTTCPSWGISYKYKSFIGKLCLMCRKTKWVRCIVHTGFVPVLTDWVYAECVSGVQRGGVPAADRDGEAEPSGESPAEEGGGGGRPLRHPGADVWAEDAVGQPGREDHQQTGQK